MKNIIKISLFSILAVFVMTACEKDDRWKDFQEFSTTSSVSGRYIVKENGFQGEWGPYSISLYNTSFDPNAVWIENIYGDGIKVKASVSGNAFSAVKSENKGNKPGTYATVSINNGTVNNGVISFVAVIYKPDGTTLDSLTINGKLFNGFDHE